MGTYNTQNIGHIVACGLRVSCSVRFWKQTASYLSKSQKWDMWSGVWHVSSEIAF